MNQTDNLRGFREWLDSFEVNEITKPEMIDSSEVVLTKFSDIKFDPEKARAECGGSPSVEDCIENHRRRVIERARMPGYLYSYEHDGKPFEVTMVPEPYYGQKIVDMLGRRSIASPDKFWKVDLEGPRAFGLTGESGSAAMGVYVRMLAAIKKLLETENPQGIVIMPSQDFMEPVYKRFVDSFLKDSFVMLHRHIYVRKDVVESAEEHRKGKIGAIAADVSAKSDKRIRRIKWLKNLYRSISMAPQSYVGKIVGFEVQSRVVPAVVEDITLSGGIKLLVDRSGFLREFNVEPGDYHRIKHPDDIVAITLKRFMEDARNKNTPIAKDLKRIPGFDGSTVVMPELPAELVPADGENDEDD